MALNLEQSIYNIREIIPKIKLNDGHCYETFDIYDYLENKWISKISVYEKSLVLNSNIFISTTEDIHQEDGNYNPKRVPHFIYTRIANNYYNIINNNKTNMLVIEDKCIFLHNSFSEGNAGHDICCILRVLTQYLNDKTIKYVVFNEIKQCNNLSIIKLFIDDEQLIKINQNVLINFKNQIFNYEQAIHCPNNYIELINKLQQLITIKINNTYDSEYISQLKNKKCCIIKNTNQKYVVRNEDQVNANVLFNYLLSENWYICNPENDDFYKMAYMLMNASIIITGQRGISCCNQIFYNLNAKIIGTISINDNYFGYGNKNEITFDNMCNCLYYHKMENLIIKMPNNIDDSHLHNIHNIITEISI